MREICFTLLGIILCLSGVFRISPGEDYVIGTQFLKISNNVVAAGMGEASGAVLKPEVSNVSANPATLYGLEKHNIVLSHNQWFAGLNYDFVGYAQAVLAKKGVLGVSGMWINDVVPLYDVNADKTGDAKVYNGTINLFSSWQLREDLQGGINVKEVFQSLNGIGGNTFGFDLGLLYQLAPRSLNLGVVVQNVGLPFRFLEKVTYLPLTLKIAAAYLVPMDKHNFVIALDVNQGINQPPRVNLGAEYNFKELFFLRLGYKIGYDLEGISLGAGARFTVSLFVYELNYAYVPHVDLGNTHRVSLVIKF